MDILTVHRLAVLIIGCTNLSQCASVCYEPQLSYNSEFYNSVGYSSVLISDY